MGTWSRREFLTTGAAAGLGVALGPGAPGSRAGAAARKIKFAGWAYNPQLVAENAKYFSQKYGIEVDYGPLPWPGYQETMETRFFGGEVVDVMYAFHPYRERWYRNGMIRSLEGFPGVDEYKKMMYPANLDNLTASDGKLVGLPYYTGFYILIYNEPMLQQAGLKPATSWEEVLAQCVELKRKGLSQFPYLPNWNRGGTGIAQQFMADCFSEGEYLWDADHNPTFEDGGVAAQKVLERWRDAYKNELVPAEILTKTSSVDAARLMWTGRIAYHTTHNYYLKRMAEPGSKDSLLAGKKAKMALNPGKTGITYSFTEQYVMSTKAANPESAWKLIAFLGGKLDNDFYVQRKWSMIEGLNAPYRDLYKDPQVKEALTQWCDPDIMEKQHEKSRGITTFKAPWYSEYDAKVAGLLQEIVRGDKTVGAGLKEMARLAKKLKKESA